MGLRCATEKQKKTKANPTQTTLHVANKSVSGLFNREKREVPLGRFWKASEQSLVAEKLTGGL